MRTWRIVLWLMGHNDASIGPQAKQHAFDIHASSISFSVSLWELNGDPGLGWRIDCWASLYSIHPIHHQLLPTPHGASSPFYPPHGPWFPHLSLPLSSWSYSNLITLFFRGLKLYNSCSFTKYTPVLLFHCDVFSGEYDTLTPSWYGFYYALQSVPWKHNFPSSNKPAFPASATLLLYIECHIGFQRLRVHSTTPARWKQMHL